MPKEPRKPPVKAASAADNQPRKSARGTRGKRARPSGVLVLHQWSFEERLLVLDRYFDVRFSVKMERKLAGDELGPLIGVSRESVLSRFKVYANMDPEMRARGIKGLGKWGKMDKEAWEWCEKHGRQRLQEEAALVRERLERAMGRRTAD